MVDISVAPTLTQPAVSPQSLELQQAYAKALLAQSMGDQPIRSPWQGVGNMVEALVGGLVQRKAGERQLQAQQAAMGQYSDLMSGLLTGGGGAQSSPSDAAAVPSAPAGGGSPLPSAGSASPMAAGAAAVPTGAPAAPAGTSMPMAPSKIGSPSMNPAQLRAFLSNPWIPADQKQQVLGLLYPQPTEAMRDYQFAVKQGFQGSMLDYQTQKALASRPVTNVDVKTAGETDFSKTYGGAQGQAAVDIIAQGDKSAANIQKSNLLAQLLKVSPPGRAAPAFSSIGAWMQSLGMNPAAVGIDPKLPATTEAINGLANEMILGKIGKGEFPANNFSEADRDFLLTTIPQITDRPEAAALKLEVSRRLDDMAIKRANELQAVLGHPPDGTSQEERYAQFSRDWRDYLQKQDLFADLSDQLKSIGQTPPAAAPAVPGAKPAPVGADIGPAPSGWTPDLWNALGPEDRARVMELRTKKSGSSAAPVNPAAGSDWAAAAADAQQNPMVPLGPILNRPAVRVGGM